MALAAAEAPCRDPGAGQFTCIVLTVPLDHLAPGTATTDVTFAIRRHTAPGDARGVLVVDRADAGASGIARADATARDLGAGIRARWDIVVPDRRGVGRSGAITCPDAAAAWRLVDTTGAGGGTVSDADLAAAAADFARDCVAETGVAPDRMRFLGTRHAAEDLEALRRYLDAPRLMLLGAGGGATLLQQYAAVHPDAVAGLILDSALDPATSATDHWLESTRAYGNTLAATLLDCTTTPACARDVRGGDAGAAYDAIARRLAEGPVVVRAPGGPAADREVTITLADLSRVAAAAVATETDRMLLQRAVAAASQDRWWHLARMVALLDRDASGVSEAARTAIACADRGLLAGGADAGAAGAAAWLRLGHENGVSATRLGGVWVTDLPCATWPAAPDPDAPLATLADPPFRVLVLGATLDPVAPWADGERIAGRIGARRGSTILTAGGSHVTWGRGRQCPDRPVTAWLSFGREPPAKGTCTANVADPYLPLAIAGRAGVGGTRAALASADREIIASADRLAWDGRDPLRIGCPSGGTVIFTAGDARTDLVLRACQMTAGVPLTGTGTIADRNMALTLELASGASGGVVTYSRTGGGEVSVSGRLATLD